MPRSDKVATTAVIGASVIAISLLAQVRIGPIWVQPLAVLVIGAILGSRGGGLAAALYVALGILGLPVFAPGVNAWTNVDYRAPYARYALGYLAGLIAAAFAVGWLTERRSWDRHRASAARLALVGIVLLYVPGVVWLKVAALLMRETRGPAGVLPSIPMLVITVAVLAFGLPRAWAEVAAMERARPTESACPDPTDADGNNTRGPALVRVGDWTRRLQRRDPYRSTRCRYGIRSNDGASGTVDRCPCTVSDERISAAGDRAFDYVLDGPVCARSRSATSRLARAAGALPLSLLHFHEDLSGA